MLGWALAELTEEEELQQQIDIKAVMVRVHAETAAAIAAMEAEVHETCPTCNHTKTSVKAPESAELFPTTAESAKQTPTTAKATESAELFPTTADPKETRASGMKSARKPLGFTPAKRGKM